MPPPLLLPFTRFADLLHGFHFIIFAATAMPFELSPRRMSAAAIAAELKPPAPLAAVELDERQRQRRR